MKSFIAIASMALIATVSAQGPVDPAKLPKGWCMVYTDGACAEGVVPTLCGANSSYTSSCISTFSMDKVCTSFNISCVCTPLNGQQKDISMEALNKTFDLMPYGMCANLIPIANSSGPGLVSGDYKPDGKRPNTTATATPTTTTGSGSAATTAQMAFSTVVLAAISLGLAMIPL
ncbi:hypothetical protein BGZ65_007103 [Modicella reniformis]|uniref:Extracellular membrane protein CFEM domain-containing protein n=1 Tax=Modicella reniformis TaxID=1440133 RepID=A0A9P6M8D0_9FUNG|nr:hypothetical protein BGZ65_007103 [Modicella reniformis]